MDVNIDIKPFEELSLSELHEVLALRSRVFVVEQEITEVPEVDGRDTEAHHLIARRDGRIVGTVRILMGCEPVKVGRVAVDAEFRGVGVGSEMMNAVGCFLGQLPAKLHAQSYLEAWYDSLGWRRSGPNFEIVGIDHVPMVWSGSKVDEVRE